VVALEVSSNETSPSLAAIVASVDTEFEYFRDQTSPDGMMTIAFTDIVESTAQMETLGEERWLQLMRTHSRIVRGCIEAHDGELVKSQGDGFMVVFASATGAQEFAIALQRALAGHNAAGVDHLRVRIGLHTGKIFAADPDQDYLGRAVVLAARITGKAGAGEILVSEACRGYTLHLNRWEYGPAVALRLKGITGQEYAYPLEW
jgi:class 3 adenylate cyclase